MRHPGNPARKLDSKPSCDLVKIWEGYDAGVHMVCYSAADGVEYSFVDGDGWYVVGDEPA